MAEEQHAFTLLLLDIPTVLQIRDQQGDGAAARFLADTTGRIAGIRDRHGGTAINAVGATMLCRFSDPGSALRAALEMRAALNSLRVAGIQPVLRISIHSGDLVMHDGNFSGEAVSTSARLMALCAPGQILFSKAAYVLLSDASRAALRPLAATTAPTRTFGELYEVIPAAGTADATLTNATLIQARQTNTSMLTSVQAPGGRRIQLTRFQRKSTPDGTALSSAASSPQSARLCLIRGLAILVVDSRNPTLTLGREQDNDIIVDVATASRHHAHVEWRENGFFLIDHSGNGTYVYDENGLETHVHNSEFRLQDSGLICPGISGSSEEADAIGFLEAR